MTPDSQHIDDASDLIGKRDHGPLDRVLCYSTFPDVSAVKIGSPRGTIRDILDMAASEVRRDKAALPLFNLLLFGDRRSEKGSLRHDANAVAMSGIVGDYDEGTITPEEARTRLGEAGVAGGIYTSPSDGQPGKGRRWRVVVPFSKDLPPDEHGRMVERLNGLFDGDLSTESFALSQSYYFGAVEGLSPVRTFTAEGDFLDLRDDLPQVGKRSRRTADDQPGDAGRLDVDAVVEALRTGAEYHRSTVELAGRYAALGLPEADAVALIKGLMGGPEAARDERFRKRFKDVTRTVADIYGKERMRRQLVQYDEPPADDPLAEIDAMLYDLPETGRSAEREFADNLAPWSDTWAGARHADRFHGRRLYVSATGQWLAWTGQRWAAQTGEETMADGLDTTAALVAEAARAVKDDPSDQTRRQVAEAAKLHGNAPRVARMIESSRAERGMHVASPAEFDANPTEITVHNGILDLRAGALHPPRPEDRVSKLAGCGFDPDARAPMWERFLETVIPDPEVRAFVQRAVGYTLTGLVNEEVFFLAYGTGRNGKSIFANTLAALLGEYTVTLGPEIVTRQRNENEAKRQEARLPGKRLALANETAEGDVWDSTRLKRLSSREKMDARHLYSEGFDFMPTSKLWVRTNHLPGALDSGDAFWARCVVVPFTVFVPPEDRIPDLDQKIIAAELPGVLNWALAGAVEWFRAGLQVPKSIRAVVQEYRADSDLLAQWIAEHTERAPGAELTVKAAFGAWREFCEGLGVKPGSAPLLSRNMGAKGHKSHRTKRGGVFRGIRLREFARQGFGGDGEEYGHLI